MLLIQPRIDYRFTCPCCQAEVQPQKLLWQGIHVCGMGTCSGCQRQWIADLPTGHGAMIPHQIDLAAGQLFGTPEGDRHCLGWLGNPFLQSLQQPCQEELTITREIFHSHSRVIILNCLDYLYGHCLLKLLNAAWHLQQQPDLGLIVIVPALLRWLVPAGVAEIWTVHLPLSQGRAYYPQFDHFVQQECQRFTEVYLSPAFSHPGQFDISDFSRVPKHSFDQPEFKITFIWREDRPWCWPILWRICRKLRCPWPALWVQNLRVRQLFRWLRQQGMTGELAIAGLGTQTTFPNWIADHRVTQFTPEIEQQLCQLYAQSRIVIGVHGSSLLLPSAHAGMTIDLMPPDRWENMGQDILYQELDPRLATFRYRFVPLSIALGDLGAIATSLLSTYAFVEQEFRSQSP